MNPFPAVCANCGRLTQAVNRAGLCRRCRNTQGYGARLLDWLASFPRPRATVGA